MRVKSKRVDYYEIVSLSPIKLDFDFETNAADVTSDEPKSNADADAALQFEPDDDDV